MPKAKLHIQGHGPKGDKINVWIVYDQTTKQWEVREKNDNGPIIDPIPGTPECTIDDIVIESLACCNPCWVKTRRGWINIC